MDKGKIDGTSALVGLLAGSLVGLGAGYMLGRHVSKRAMERELEREVAGLKDHYRAKAETSGRRDYSGSGRSVPPVGNAGGRFSDLALTATNPAPGSRIVSVSPIDPDGEDDPNEDADDDEEDGDPAFFRDAVGIAEEIREKASLIYIISEEEFHDEMETYQKISIYYYPGEDLLVDDRKARIPNPFAVCGDFKQGFGKDPANPHIVHIRNNYLKADFEISIVEGTYAESLYGRPP
jgi:hypothetical protein